MIKKAIPSFVTSLNLASGFFGIIMAFNNHLAIAAFLTGCALIFDFADGFLARLLKVKSEFGKQIDSLADMVTFGILPAIISYQLLLQGVNQLQSSNALIHFLPYFAVIIAVFSGLRLAKFNIDTRQTDSFIGLATPANATFIASLPLIVYYANPSSYIGNLITTITLNPFIYSIIILALSLLLVCELPMFSLKHIAKGWKQNKVQFVFLISTILLLIFLQFTALPIVILLYILLSIYNHYLIPKKIS